MDQDQLERYELQMGGTRGKLAMASDLLTDALVLVGQHGVYCQSARQLGKPALDIQIVTRQIEGAKELVAGVIQELRQQRAKS